MSEHRREPGVVLDDPASPMRTERPPARHRIALTIGVLVLLLAVAASGAVFLVSETLGNHVARVPGVFGPLKVEDRPVQGPAENFLVVGTDTRSAEPTTGTDAPADAQPGSQRSDVIMVVQLASDKKSAAVVSLPRDSWVDIPGHGKNKINAAYAFGGPTLLVQTVEQLTGVRIDHFAVIDFAGFQDMVDAVGGIDVTVAQTTSDRGVIFQKGANHLNGADALVYVRQRHGLPNGDLDRAHREQNALKALLAKVASSGMLSSPIELYRIVDAISRSVSVDDTLTNGGLRGLAISSTGLRASAIEFLNAPIAGFGREREQSVNLLDSVHSNELWSAMRAGTTIEYARSHPADTLSDEPV